MEKSTKTKPVHKDEPKKATPAVQKTSATIDKKAANSAFENKKNKIINEMILETMRQVVQEKVDNVLKTSPATTAATAPKSSSNSKDKKVTSQKK